MPMAFQLLFVNWWSRVTHPSYRRLIFPELSAFCPCSDKKDLKQVFFVCPDIKVNCPEKYFSVGKSMVFYRQIRRNKEKRNAISQFFINFAGNLIGNIRRP